MMNAKSNAKPEYCPRSTPRRYAASTNTAAERTTLAEDGRTLLLGETGSKRGDSPFGIFYFLTFG